MKLLMLLAVVVAIVWLWRSARGPAAPKSSHAVKPTASNPLAMVQCAVCAVHVPEADVVSGQRGNYCSEQHRRQAEA